MKNIILLLKVIFVFAFFISVPQTIYGQNKDLVLTHKVSGTEYIIYRKYKIEVTNNEA